MNNRFWNTMFFSIATALLIVPFFWFRPGFLDLGGDSGRLYFLDPWSSFRTMADRQNFFWAPMYAIVPHMFFLSLLSQLLRSPWLLLTGMRSIELSGAFVCMFLLLRALLRRIEIQQRQYIPLVSMTGAFLYIGCIAHTGWQTALDTHYHVLLDPFLMYIFLLLMTERSYLALKMLCLISVIFSANFGFSAMPQLVSYVPFMILFLFFLFRFIVRKKIYWKHFIVCACLFFGLHAYQIVPTAAAVFRANSARHQQIFSTASIYESGVKYFQANHESLGKISTPLMQGNLFLPIVACIGFFIQPSSVLLLTGSFFALLLFFVSANITQLGATLYQSFFYVPGFLMFRSFQEKWYVSFSVFFILFATFCLMNFSRILKMRTFIFLCAALIITTVWFNREFFSGKTVSGFLYQSDRVETSFLPDPDWTDALAFVRTLPNEGSFLSLPLTFPYYQVVFGTQGGAYVGVSPIIELTQFSDYSGFWSFTGRAEEVFSALREKDTQKLQAILRSLGVKYIFHNSDDRIMTRFPGYPYVYPGVLYSSKEQIPAIADQNAYETLIHSLPVAKIFEKGFFSVYEIQYPEPVQFVRSVHIPKNEQLYYWIGLFFSMVSVVGLMILKT